MRLKAMLDRIGTWMNRHWLWCGVIWSAIFWFTVITRASHEPFIFDEVVSWRVARLPSLTNRSFLVERGNAASAQAALGEEDAYVLRLPGKGTELYIDRAGEAANRRAVAGIGLAPPILYADPASGVMLSRYIAGAVPLSPERLHQGDHFRAAIGLLQRLHGSGLAFTGEMRLYPKLDQYLAMVSTPVLRELRRAGEALRPVIEPGWGPLRPCRTPEHRAMMQQQRPPRPGTEGILVIGNGIAGASGQLFAGRRRVVDRSVHGVLRWPVKYTLRSATVTLGSGSRPGYAPLCGTSATKREPPLPCRAPRSPPRRDRRGDQPSRA